MVFSFLVAGERRSAGGCSLAGRCAKGHWPFSVFVWANAPPRTVFSCWAVSCLVGAALVGLRTCPGDRSPRLCGPARRLSTCAPSPCSMARPGMGVASTPRVAGRLAPKAPGSPSTWLQSTPPAWGRLLRLVFDTHLYPNTLLQPTPAHRAALSDTVDDIDAARQITGVDMHLVSRRKPSPAAARGRLDCADRRSPRQRRVARSPARTAGARAHCFPISSGSSCRSSDRGGPRSHGPRSHNVRLVHIHTQTRRIPSRRSIVHRTCGLGRLRGVAPGGTGGNAASRRCSSSRRRGGAAERSSEEDGLIDAPRYGSSVLLCAVTDRIWTRVLARRTRDV